jgi:hypothetical protein
MGRLVESIAKYSRRFAARADHAGSRASPSANEGFAGPGAAGAPCGDVGVRAGKGRRGTPERVLRRPDPAEWSADELMALHEAVGLLWPEGPVTVSGLRTAIAKGELAHARIAGRIYTTRAALAAMAVCRKTVSAAGGPAAPEVDWEARLATLLPKRGGGG